MSDGGGARCFNRGFVVTNNRKEIAVAHEFDWSLGGAPNGRFVDRLNGGATVWLAHDTRVHHAIDLHVVNEGTFTENFCWQIEARTAFADALEIGYALANGHTGC